MHFNSTLSVTVNKERDGEFAYICGSFIQDG